MLGTGLQIAAPVLAATLVADVILGFLGKASPQMPLMLLGPRAQKHVGRGLARDGHPLLAGIVSSVTSQNRWDLLSDFCIWRRSHEREQDRETHTAATAKSARARPGRALAGSCPAFWLCRAHSASSHGRAIRESKPGEVCCGRPSSSPAQIRSRPHAPLFVWTGWTLVKCVVPVMATAWTMSLLGGLAQGGLVFAPEALIPKVERAQPGARN